MPRHPVILLAVLATAVAGCGTTSAPGPAGDAPRIDAKAAPGTGLRVTANDGRVGDATRANAAGSIQLKVPTQIVDPAKVRRHNHRHQGVGAGASCADADVMPDASTMPTVISATLCLLNGERADAGLPPLAQNDRLAQAAVEHSQDLVTNQYFDHQAPDGRDVVDRVRATGYIPEDRRWTVGENLAWGTGTLATPRNIVAAWMNSQGHRENILRPEFREIGFGVITGNPRSTDGQGATYTTNFGAVSGGSEVTVSTDGSTTTTQTASKSAKSPRAHTAAVRARRARSRMARAHRVRLARAVRAARRRS
jgi:uncharacterized protein YkwD